MVALTGCSAPAESTEAMYKDGTYTASSAAYEDLGEVQLKDVVTIDVVDGKITRVDWNQEIKGGGDRRTVSTEQGLMVVQGGAQAPWHEQADKTAAYLVETQDTTAPDSISGVTIDIVDFFTLSEEALKGAK